MDLELEVLILIFGGNLCGILVNSVVVFFWMESR